MSDPNDRSSSQFYDEWHEEPEHDYSGSHASSQSDVYSPAEKKERIRSRMGRWIERIFDPPKAVPLWKAEVVDLPPPPETDGWDEASSEDKHSQRGHKIFITIPIMMGIAIAVFSFVYFIGLGELIGLSIFVIFILFQLLPILIILNALIRKKKLNLHARAKFIFFFGLGAAPSLLLILSAVPTIEWTGGARFGWVSLLNQEDAGATTLPIWFIAQIAMSAGLYIPKFRYNKVSTYVATVTLALICLWYVLSTLTLNTSNEPRSILWVFPAIPCTSLILLSLHLRIWRSWTTPSAFEYLLIIPYVGSIAGTVLWRIRVAKEIYAALPTESPECFIVTAAARGHARFVGSSFDPVRGYRINMQLRRMKAFENLLRDRFPQFHIRLRKIYNYLGPKIARRIRSPYIADVVYICLKPIELFVLLVIYFVRKHPRP